MMSRTSVVAGAVFALALLGHGPNPAEAGALYSVTDLGAADPGANYLNALNPGDQATFRSSSFDPFAHPAVVPQPFPDVWYDGDRPWNPGDTTYQLSNPIMATSNNQGVTVGFAQERLWINPVETQVVEFSPQPHSVSNPPPWLQHYQSPGYLYQIDANPLGLDGTLSGINDAWTIIGANRNNPHGYLTPMILNSNSHNNVTQSLNIGSLGGNNGSANAINNANQVVGWSETSGGVKHAFFYANSVMTDLNSLIPTPSAFVLNDAVGIDADGRIVAFGTDASGAAHEYLLTPDPGAPSPVPEPSALATLVLGLGGLALGRSSQRRRAA